MKMARALIHTRLPRASEAQLRQFESRCDQNEIRQLCAKELDLDETLGFYAAWSAGWWQTLHEIDRVRTRLIDASRRMAEGASA